MSPKERLKKIEKGLEVFETKGWKGDIHWLIARVKKLTEVLELIKQHFMEDLEDDDVLWDSFPFLDKALKGDE